MKILLYCRRFHPDVGGIESASLTLAEQIAAAGHACTVVTETTAGHTLPEWKFAIERAPNPRRRIELVRNSDVVHSMGASLSFFPYAKLGHRPFMWTHQGYQLVAVDGLGWVDGNPAPLTPIASLRFHYQRAGMREAAIQAVKLGLRRAVGHVVDKNIAVTRWVAYRQPLPRQVVIYNPFSLARFKRASLLPETGRYDFLFVGRLVTEKGVDVLLRALALLNGTPGRQPATLLIIGDGPHRPILESFVSSSGLAPHVRFAGTKVGDELVDALPQGKIAVVPSAWEEALGGVALELLAAGRPTIVSERGGLGECVADGGWTFPNGNHAALAEVMARLLDDEVLRHSRRKNAQRIVERFNEAEITREYLRIYAELSEKRP